MNKLEPIDPSKPFSHAKLKHVWANRHFDNFNAIWSRYIDAGFCELMVQTDPLTGNDYFGIVSVKALPAEIPLVLGDAIHNLKSALDYTISEILGWHDKRITFPMAEDREELKTSFATSSKIGRDGAVRKGRNHAIEQAVPGFGKFLVDTIRPYKRADGFLWPLNRLDVRDKHRLLVPLVVPQGIHGVSAVSNNGTRFGNVSFGFGGRGFFCPFEVPGGGLKVTGHGKPTAEILFNEVGVIESKSVFPTFTQMSQAVAETINAIEHFVTASQWQPPPRQ